jgi:TonB-linked SusC/RagA family outer membrane protein
LIFDEQRISEVVVYGYGTQKKSDLTGSISSISGKELDLQSIKRADQALQGKVSGVYIQNTDGAPGGKTTVRVRGSNSILGGNNALVVVDGVQDVSLEKINPSDIESIEVLKDASSTAIFGARGANGVIIVTTKKGQIGKPQINYSGTFGFQLLANEIETLSAGDYARNINDVRALSNQHGTPEPVFTASEITAFDNTVGTNWQEELYRTAPMQNHQVSISGGSDKSKYYVSGGFLNQDGILVNSDYKRYSFQTSVNTTFNKWISGGVILNIVKDEGKSPNFGGDSQSGLLLGTTGSVLIAPRWGAVVPVYDANGNYTKHPAGWGAQDTWNPIASALEVDPYYTNFIGRVNAYFDIKLLESLTINIRGIGSDNIAKSSMFYNEKTQEGLPSGGKAGYGTTNSYETRYNQFSAGFNYDKSIGESHLNLVAVAEQSTSDYVSGGSTAKQFISTTTGLMDLAGAGTVTIASYANKRVLQSYLVRANYSLMDKYLFTVSFRADGSSVFGDNNKWGYFPSASVAWKLSKEEFIKNLEVFTELKLRGSYGVTGNQAISPYQTQASISSGNNYPWDGGDNTNPGFGLSQAANPDLKWESTSQVNLGMDMGFFEGRLTATIDLYKKITDDLLLYRPLALSAGFNAMIDNVGSVENKGFELEIGGTPVSGVLTWKTDFIFSLNRSEVISIGKNEYLPFGEGHGGSGYEEPLMRLVAGEPFGQMYGYKYLGVWKTSEAEEAARYGLLPGDPRHEDIDGDGLVDLNDIQIIGNSLPDFVYGWSNTLTYKNVSLDFLFQGVKGNDIFNEMRIRLENPAEANTPAILTRWTPENENSMIPGYIDAMTRLNAGLTQNDFSDSRSTRWIEDGSYIKLKYITLGYKLTNEKLAKAGIQSIRLSLSGTNLFTITKYKGYDPEVSSFNENDAQVGIDYGNYPTARIFSFGVDVTF